MTSMIFAMLTLKLTLCLSMLTDPPDGPEENECYRIRGISISGLDVFEDRDRKYKHHRLFQALHATTHDSVITRELLFERGDCFDRALVAETERNLRQMRNLSDAYITPTFDRENHLVDLVVTTVDKFTLRALASVSHKGGITKSRFTLGESNFLGFNKAIYFSDVRRSDGNQIQRYVYKDPRFLKLFQMKGIYSSTDEGVYRELTFQKPFWSLEGRNAFSFHFFDDLTKSDVYGDGGELLAEIPNDLSTFSLNWEHERGTRQKSRRSLLALGYKDMVYSPLPGQTAPDPIEVLPLVFSYHWLNREDYAVMKGVDSLIKREDIALFSGFSLGGGGQWRQTAGQSELHGLVSAGYRRVGTPGERQLVALNFDGRMRFYSGETRSANLKAFYHHYFFIGNRASWVAGMAWEYAFTSDDLYLPLTLGEDRGLRGYDAFSFTGNKLFQLNLEHRYSYPFRNRHWALGQVVFLDGGGAKKPGSGLQPRDLHWSLGWGLRIDAPSLFGAKIGRLDFAYALDEGGLTISFSTGHIFKHNASNQGFDRDF